MLLTDRNMICTGTVGTVQRERMEHLRRRQGQGTAYTTCSLPVTAFARAARIAARYTKNRAQGIAYEAQQGICGDVEAGLFICDAKRT